MTLEEIVRKHFLEVLEECKGNRQDAANALGVSVRTVGHMCHKYGVGKRKRSPDNIMRNVTPHERDRNANRVR